jgi:hypothetical protein
MAPRVLLVSGHTTDAPGRPQPRFPDSEVPAVERQVADVLQAWDVGPGATVVCGGARGADLIVAGQALDRGADVRLCLALSVEQFVERSVRSDGTGWVERFRRVAARARVDVQPDADPRHPDDNVFARANAWMVDTVRSLDDRPHVLLVWNGAEGDGPGGTHDLLDRLGLRTAQDRDRVAVIDPTPRAYAARERVARPKRILAADGGGIRAVLSLEILDAIERQLRDRYGRPGLVLADYFDYIAGTSTGAILAAALSLGHPVAAIRERYLALGTVVFRRRFLPLRWFSLYDDAALRRELDDFFGTGRTLGDPELRTLLLAVMHNTATDSPWPLSNATTAKYNRADRLLLDPPDRNLDIPLGPLIRASCAAPIYFPPEQLPVGDRTFQFQDGGITPYNNPALLAFVMATLPDYGLGWPTGADEILVVSVGTGSSAAVHPRLRRRAVTLPFNARNLPSVFMNGAAFGQDLLARSLGRCRFGPPLDREVGDRVNGVPLGGQPLFTYVRYNADLADVSLQQAGIHDARTRARLRKLDAVRHIPTLQELGRRAARDVDVASHFAGFLGDD